MVTLLHQRITFTAHVIGIFHVSVVRDSFAKKNSRNLSPSSSISKFFFIFLLFQTIYFVLFIYLILSTSSFFLHLLFIVCIPISISRIILHFSTFSNYLFLPVYLSHFIHFFFLLALVIFCLYPHFYFSNFSLFFYFFKLFILSRLFKRILSISSFFLYLFFILCIPFFLLLSFLSFFISIYKTFPPFKALTTTQTNDTFLLHRPAPTPHDYCFLLGVYITPLVFL